MLGAIVLIWIGFHLRRHLRVGDLILTFFIWYGVVRFGLEALRADNWTFFGVPTAQLVSAVFIVVAGSIMLYRHRPGHPVDDPPTHPEVATWGAIGRPVAVASDATAEVEAVDAEMAAAEGDVIDAEAEDADAAEAESDGPATDAEAEATGAQSHGRPADAEAEAIEADSTDVEAEPEAQHDVPGTTTT